MPVGELVRIQLVLHKWHEFTEDQLLMGFHGEGGEGNGSVVIQFFRRVFFGGRGGGACTMVLDFHRVGQHGRLRMADRGAGMQVTARLHSTGGDDPTQLPS